MAWPRLLPARGAHLHAQQSRTRGFHAPPPPHSPVALGGLLRTCPLHRGSRHLVAMVPAQGWAADKHRVRAGPRRSGYSAHCPWGRHRVLAGPPQAGGAGPTALGRGVGGTLPAQDPAGRGQAAPTPQASAPPKLMPSLPRHPTGHAPQPLQLQKAGAEMTHPEPAAQGGWEGPSANTRERQKGPGSVASCQQGPLARTKPGKNALQHHHQGGAGATPAPGGDARGLGRKEL